MSQEKLFRLAEANALLPQIERRVEKIQRLAIKIREELAACAPECGEQALPQLALHDLVQRNPALRQLFEEMAQTVEEIERFGCHFKGLELGLVDFPTVIDGEVVELCWQYGEKEIAFYHRRTEGFAGRRPLNPGQQATRYYH
ncbi:MAG: DUF2203 domain-containing protein [Candidatus Binatia bacterium]|nr:DUF2203 domain-containing protein [Candidatus Binatia bacterium]